MNKNTRRLNTGLILSLILMFALIPITVALTHNKAIADFTDTERFIFNGFIIAELLLTVSAFYFAFRIGGERKKNNMMQSGANTAPAPDKKPSGAQRSILPICSIAVAGLFRILGSIILKHQSFLSRSDAQLIAAVFAGVPLLAIIAGMIASKLYIKRISNRSVGEMNRFIVSHRDKAEEVTLKKLRVLQRIRRLSDIYAVILFICGAGCAFFSWFTLSVNMCCWIIPAFLFCCGFSRLRSSKDSEVFECNVPQLPSDEYKELFSIVRRAAATLGCNGEIKIYITCECNASITKCKGCYIVLLGVRLFDIMSDEELYCIMLHEFSHMSAENEPLRHETAYNSWVCDKENKNPLLSWISSKAFSLPDTVYNFQFNLFIYASSVLVESKADRAMSEYGDKNAAASSLLKLHYSYIFEWESSSIDHTDVIYAGEEPPCRVLHKQISDFRKAITERADDWKLMAQSEILSRSASHPTVRMRIEAMGVTEYTLLDKNKSEKLSHECENAVDLAESWLTEQIKENYDSERKRLYLEPLSTLEEWKAAGEPIVAEEYADIVVCLRVLGRVSEAIALCDRVINTLGDESSHYAYFIKGCYLLHRLDPSGIDLIYRAIDNNSNYIDEGLEEIGSFCCLTGIQDELDKYRKNAEDLVQKQVDEYRHTGVLELHDHLTEEHLPDGMLESILSFIRFVSDDSIASVRLVRKIIGSNFFTSVFIIEFVPGTDEDKEEKIMHRIFSHLDTCSDWQFSLFNYKNLPPAVNKKIKKIHGSLVYIRK